MLFLTYFENQYLLLAWLHSGGGEARRVADIFGGYVNTPKPITGLSTHEIDA